MMLPLWSQHIDLLPAQNDFIIRNEEHHLDRLSGLLLVNMHNVRFPTALGRAGSINQEMNHKSA